MDTAENLNMLFHQAVSAIDAGNVAQLEALLMAHPQLVRERLAIPGTWLRDTVGTALDGFFQKPYLLWFVAEDPVRTGRLPHTIAEVTQIILQAAQREQVDNLQEQLDYALRLVAWSLVAPACGVQIALLDVLLTAGASADGVPEQALVNGNIAAANYLIELGAQVTIAAALCLERWDDVDRLAQAATARDKQLGLVLAALTGNAAGLARVIPLGVDLNAPSADLYPHATAVHHAVSSGSLDAVRVLVEAGADLHVTDTVYHGTPLAWAEYGKHTAIASYLREC